jgi:hypothetical protein
MGEAQRNPSSCFDGLMGYGASAFTHPTRCSANNDVKAWPAS